MTKSPPAKKNMETYGRARLERVLKANYHRTPQQVAEKVFADIDHFRGATALTDDQTIVALRVLCRDVPVSKRPASLRTGRTWKNWRRNTERQRTSIRRTRFWSRWNEYQSALNGSPEPCLFCRKGQFQSGSAGHSGARWRRVSISSPAANCIACSRPAAIRRQSFFPAWERRRRRLLSHWTTASIASTANRKRRLI